jgi:PAS domain S-box-containing protein
MQSNGNTEKFEYRIKDLETKLSELKLELAETKSRLETSEEKKLFYQLVADFTFGWELWIQPNGNIKYCSPSCNDITGYTANQIIAAESISELLVYTADRQKFNGFVEKALDQMIINESLEFRILTRTKQLRWCIMNVRGIYNTQGRYLGVRASIQDITKLKQAMGHIQNLSEQREVESRNQDRLKSELEIKERELVSFLLQLSQKNELIALIKRKLTNLSTGGKNQKDRKLEQLISLLEGIEISTVDWEMVNVQLERLYPGFLRQLEFKHPRLTNKEKKLCAGIRLGLSSKEIAGLTNNTPQSVEVARVRLRKKLKLSREMRLFKYLNQLA